jgi:hypothetical protein
MKERAARALAKTFAGVVALGLVFFGMAEKLAAAPATAAAATTATKNDKPQISRHSLDAYRLWQTTDLWGDSIVSITPDAMRLENPRTGVSMLICKPFDTIYLFNTQTKSICKSPFKTFRCPIAKTFELFTSFHVDEVPMMPDGEQTLLNLPAKKYKSSKAFSTRQYRLQVTDHIPGSNPHIVENVNSEFFKSPTSMNTALSRFYNLPIVPGLPLWARIENLNKEHTVTLRTVKTARLKMDSATFAVPSGYKAVEHGAEVIRSNMSPESMELFGGR